MTYQSIGRRPDQVARVPVDDTERLAQLDKQCVLHSWSTQEDYHSGIVVGGDGMWFWDQSGRRLLDFTSQAFFANVGHGNSRIADAVASQVREVSFAYGFGNVPKLRLVERLLDLLPDGYRRVWFGLNGSDAIELALKAARLVTGRQTVVSFFGEYHGSAMGATSITGMASLRQGIGALVPGSLFLPGPHPHDSPVTASPQDESDQITLQLLRHTLERMGPETVAAVIAEPLLTGGMPAPVTIPGRNYWRDVRELCDEFGVLLISDEVVTGFGRTGHWFARDYYQYEPDIICLGKGITSGYLPLSAVVFGDSVVEALEGRFLPHGLTHTGHPVCCAAALANIDAIDDDDLVGNANSMGKVLAAGLDWLRTRHGCVVNVNSLGLFGGLELDAAATGGDNPGDTVAAMMEERNVIVRGGGDVVKVGPPLIVDSSEIDFVINLLDEVLTQIGAGRPGNAKT